jgi:hypothetical protein
VDYRYIVSCWEEAAAGGYAVAQYDLGMLYYRGTNVHPMDLPRALALFQLADDQVWTRWGLAQAVEVFLNHPHDYPPMVMALEGVPIVKDA